MDTQCFQCDDTSHYDIFITNNLGMFVDFFEKLSSEIDMNIKNEREKIIIG